MTGVQVLEVLVAVGVVLVAIGLALAIRELARRSGSSEPLIARRVVVNLKSGTAIAGVITSNEGGLLTIKGAEVIEPERNPVPADGEIIVDRSHVDYIQAL